MGISDIFKNKNTQSMSEMEQETERNAKEINFRRQQLLLNRLKAEQGSDAWKNYSSNGKKSGVDFNRLWRLFENLGKQK